MRIGFDAKRAFQNRTGLGNYARTLLSNLKTYFPSEEYVLFAPNKQTEFQKRFQDDAVVTPARKHLFWRSLGIKKDIRTTGVELFHGLSNELPFGIDRTGIPSVVTIHDVIFDIIEEDFPWHDRMIYRMKTRKCIAQASKIIAISEATKSDLIERFNADPNKIEVIYQPIDCQFDQPIFSPRELEASRKKHQLPERYMLYVGALMKRKNILSMIRAWQQLPPEHAFPLLIYGNGNQYKQEVIQYIRNHDLEDRVQLREQLPFEDLPCIYRLADVVLYPSLYEGFGLPVAEALACGTRVVTSSVSSMPEAGGTLCQYVDPHSVSSIAEGIVRSLNEPRPDPEAISKHLKQFDSFTLTEQIVNVYRELTGN